MKLPPIWYFLIKTINPCNSNRYHYHFLLAQYSNIKSLLKKLIKSIFFWIHFFFSTSVVSQDGYWVHFVKSRTHGWFENQCLKSHTNPPKKLCFCFHWKPFKNNEKCFLFHLKNSFHYEVFKFLSLLFAHVKKRLD